jgi:hypothetical protein
METLLLAWVDGPILKESPAAVKKSAFPRQNGWPAHRGCPPSNTPTKMPGILEGDAKKTAKQMGNEVKIRPHLFVCMRAHTTQTTQTNPLDANKFVNFFTKYGKRNR